jgi:hypothetical protein
VRILTSSTKLPEFTLPIKVNGNPAQLDLRSLIHDDEKRGALHLFSTRIPEKLEKIIAKPFVLSFKKYLADYKFKPDYYNDDNFHILANEIVDFLRKDLALKSTALLKVVDDLYFRPRSSKEAISADVRKLFIHAYNAARDELIYEKNSSSVNDPHEALSEFERRTGKTPHYNLEVPSSFDKPVRAFMPVQTEELNWQHQSLNVLKELFKLDEKEAKSIVKYLSMFSDDNLQIEGYARIDARQPYLNLSGRVLDRSIHSELNDLDLEHMPLSTVIHEITHVLLKDRYPNIFKANPGLGSPEPEDKQTFEVSFGNQKHSFPLAYFEELICFALTIHINPLTTVLKLASIKSDSKVKENYAAASVYGKYLYGKYLHLKYKPGNPGLSTDTLKSIKSESLEMARASVQLLDKYIKKP